MSLEISRPIIFEVNIVHSLVSRQTIHDTHVVFDKSVYGGFLANGMSVVYVFISWYTSNVQVID